MIERGESAPATREQLDVYIARSVENGVRAEEFVEAVAWSDNPLVVKAVGEIEKRSDDHDILDVMRQARARRAETR